MFPRLRKLLTLRRRWERTEISEGKMIVTQYEDTFFWPANFYDWLDSAFYGREETGWDSFREVPMNGSLKFKLIHAVRDRTPYRLRLLRRWRTERRWELK